jgi:tetratricopeptide (TPR) repeat protein
MDQLSARVRWLALGAVLAVAASPGLTGCAGGRALGRLPDGVGPEPDDRPGTAYVRRALLEYDVFYTDKARSSLRAAAQVDPGHPLARAYLVLIGVRDEAERREALAALRVVEAAPNLLGRERRLVRAALVLGGQGPLAAREALLSSDKGRAATSASKSPPDPELAFWAAELAFDAGRYDEANAEYRALLKLPEPPFRGRIYDHASASMLFRRRTVEALEVGRRYAEEFPGEADALGVYATTLAHRGRHAEALRYATLALSLSESEDTLAGLAKVHALRGDLALARQGYLDAMRAAGPPRRVLRRAAAAMVALAQGDAAGARRTTAPCRAGGAEATQRERGACLFVAALADPPARDDIIRQLTTLAADSRAEIPVYGNPAGLADLLRSLEEFDGGGCVTRSRGPVGVGGDPPEGVLIQADFPTDFFADYHVPFFNTWALCNTALETAWRGDPAAGKTLLEEAAAAFPGNGLLALTLAEIVSGTDPPGARGFLKTWEGVWDRVPADSALGLRAKSVRTALEAPAPAEALASRRPSDRGVALPAAAATAVNEGEAQSLPEFYERSVALVVGVDRYAGGWPTLERAVDDARRMASALRARGFDVVLLENPTRHELMRQLETELPERVGPKDRFVFYFAGHGQTFSSPATGEQLGYVVPADGARKAGRDEWHTYISMREITDGLKTRFASRHVLLIFDSCFSGLALSRSGGSFAAVQTHLRREGVTVLTAGGQGELARDGLFTGVLIKGLNGQADGGARPDGFVTFGELAIYVEREVQTENPGQLPRYGWLRGEGQMVFIVPDRASTGRRPID